MTATDELRALLDEHGVEYSAEDGKTVWATRWEFGHSSALFTEYDDGECVFVTSGHTWTPEQAIAATLGSDRDEIYNAGFDSGVKACLQILDGYLDYPHSAAENIQKWVDEQWKEYES